MCSATSSPSFLFLPSNTPLIQRCKFSIFNSPSPQFFCCLRPTIPRPHLSASLAEKDVEFSWFSPNQNPSDDYGGWAIVECPVQQKRKKGIFFFIFIFLNQILLGFPNSNSGFLLKCGFFDNWVSR